MKRPGPASRILLAAALIAGPAGVLLAQQQQPPPQSGQPMVGLMQRTPAPTMPRFDGDMIERGRAVVVGAVAAGSGQDAQPRLQACFSCHGMSGAGDASGAFPRLAGQPAFYLYKQMVDYASGARPNDIMSPIAQALTREEMEAVAAYYAAQRNAETFPAPAGDALLIQKGAALSAVGSVEQGIQACVNCHGPSGRGLPPTVPALAGQYATYTELQLQLWKQGVRKNDPLDVMADIVKRMSDEDIRATALYFAQLSPPDATRGPAQTTEVPR